MPRFYHVGEGKEPFCLTYSSTEYIIYPSDQHWKRVDQEYEVGKFQNGKPLKLTRKVWVPDPECKKRKPHNYLDLTADQAAYLKSGKFQEEREYIKEASEIHKELEAEEDDMLVRHSEKMADLKRKQALEIKALEEAHARAAEQAKFKK